MANEIELIRNDYDHEKKCGGCGWRTPVLWNLGEDEPDHLEVCSDCTVRHLAGNDEFTLLQESNENPEE